MTREIPLLCTDEVVRAYLAGRKTQTRRPIKWATNPCGEPADHLCQIGTTGRWIAWWGPADQEACQQLTDRVYRPEVGLPGLCQPGDRVWIRETWWQRPSDGVIIYAADGAMGFDETSMAHRMGIGNIANEKVPDAELRRCEFVKRPSIHMPRWAARIVLPVVSVRAERVRDITPEDCRAEGSHYPVDQDDEGGFFNLWNSLYGDRHPVETTWCWVIETKPFKGASQ
jgi:hypothetical protein